MDKNEIKSTVMTSIINQFMNWWWTKDVNVMSCGVDHISEFRYLSDKLEMMKHFQKINKFLLEDGKSFTWWAYFNWFS